MMMKMKRIALMMTAILLLASCDRFEVRDQVFENRMYLDVSAKNAIQLASFSNKLETMTKELGVVLALPEDSDVKATVAVDNGMVAVYNKKYGTSYDPVPEKFMDFQSQEVIISAGKICSEKIQVNLKGLSGEGEEHTGEMIKDEVYLLPVRIISSDMQLLEGADVAYYLVKRSSAITTAADLTDNWINFPLLDQPGPQADVYNGLTAITYEALIYINRFDLNNRFGACAISTIMGVEQHCLFRIGDTNYERQQLQFDGSGTGSEFGKFPEMDPAKKLYEGEWYHVACTFDQETRIVRVYAFAFRCDPSAKPLPRTKGRLW